MSTLNIPRLPSTVPREVQRALDAIADYLKKASLESGNDSGEVIQQNNYYSIDAPPIDTSPPAQMSGLVVTPLFNKILLEWDAYAAGVQVEIHRSETDDLGSAAQVGQCPSAQSLFSDHVPDSSLAKTYYYWTRGNRNGTPGPWNQTAGTSGTTADDPEYLMEISTEKWKASFNYALADLTMPTVPNGYCYEVTVDNGSSGLTEPLWPVVIDQTVTDGDLTWKCKASFSFEEFFKLALVSGVPKLALKELFLADGIIKRAMIDDLAVDNAKIDNLSVSKLLAGIISASNIFVGASSRIHIDGVNEQITVSDANRVRVRLGKIGTDWAIEIFDAAGNTIVSAGGGVPSTAVSGLGSLATLNGFTVANISSYFESLAIGEGLINNAAVTTLKIGPNAVTVPVSSSNPATLTLSNTSTGEYYSDPFGGPAPPVCAWSNVLSGTINSGGQPIVLIFNAVGHIWADGKAYICILLEIQVDGSVIETNINLLVTPILDKDDETGEDVYGRSARGGATIMRTLYLSSGDHVITVRARRSYRLYSTASLTNRNLLLLGVKR